jgi:GR25 family glycosyltransferase involved in LPS biosynthesis
MSFAFYCLSFNSPERKENITGRLNELKVNFTISEGFKRESKALSTMLGHLNLIRQFYDSEYEYGIICEDGIFLHKNLKNDIPKLIEDFNVLNLDILLMGYLIACPFIPDGVILKKNENYSSIYKMITPLWGAQMYMISKKYAKECLDRYAETEKYIYLEEDVEKERLLPPEESASDWSITKNGNRAICHPMLAIKDGSKFYEDLGQRRIHHETFFCNLTRDHF